MYFIAETQQFDICYLTLSLSHFCILYAFISYWTGITRSGGF